VFDVWHLRRWNAAMPATKQFAPVAELLTQLPASDGRERPFSMFVCLFNERRLRSDIGLVEAGDGHAHVDGLPSRTHRSAALAERRRLSMRRAVRSAHAAPLETKALAHLGPAVFFARYVLTEKANL
jgi:hypothetical protein